MPTYEYECEKCGKVFDHFQSMSAAPLETCPDEICGEKGRVRRLVGAGSGLIFKGTGFYITDYKKKSGGEAGSGGAEPAKTESKPAASETTSTPAKPAASGGGATGGGTASS